MKLWAFGSKYEQNKVITLMLKKIGVLLLAGALPFALASAQQQKPDTPKPAAEDRNEKKDSIDKALADAPKSAGAAIDPNTYKLGPEDIIFVNVFHDQDFSGGRIVRPDGKISFPIVGEVDAAGATPHELAKRIAEKLSAVIKEPIVDVQVTQVNSKKYFIQGGCSKTGTFTLTTPVTVLEALSNCGGFKDFANKKKIVILRKGQRLKFNYEQVIKGKNPDQNITLEPGDYIIIPE